MSAANRRLGALREPCRAADGRKLVFLFVDDAREQADHTRLLESFGYAVRVSKNPGSVSGGVLDFQPAALVINNRQQRYIDENLAALRRLYDSGRLTCPAIFVGDRDDMRLRLAAVRGGCGAFLDHPADPMALVEAVDRLSAMASEDPLRVLIIDDSRVSARFHSDILARSGIATRIVTAPMEVAGPLKDFQPELILMDLVMPDCSGQELAGVIRQEEAYDSIPIVFLSGEGDRDRQLSALGQGGDDFLTKPIEPSHLVLSVTIRANRFRGLRALIERDGLTGLYNHSATKAHIVALLERGAANGENLTLAILDLDHFKKINDDHGHAVGDMVIKSIARLLRQQLRRTDIIGRIGGEEFAAVLPGLAAPQAHGLIDRVRLTFCDIRHRAATGPFSASFSAGLADIAKHHTPNDLSNAADSALYSAKGAGRNQVTLA
jgi:diguanylate cyclase (GGDEF)-like protein